MDNNVKYQNPNVKINPKSQYQIIKHWFCHLRFVICAYFVICALTFVIQPSNSFAQSISSTELINNAKLYDGKIIAYEGEVIGDIMKRGQFAWINLNDGKNAIGIWVNKDLTREILLSGSYRYRGDWIEVTGVFHRACLEHGGDLDIHAQALRKINNGRLIVERANLEKRNFFLILSGVLCLILILTQLKRKSKK